MAATPSLVMFKEYVNQRIFDNDWLGMFDICWMPHLDVWHSVFDVHYRYFHIKDTLQFDHSPHVLPNETMVSIMGWVHRWNKDFNAYFNDLWC